MLVGERGRGGAGGHAELREDVATWRATVCSLSTSSAAIARLSRRRRPAQDLELARGQPVASPDAARRSASTRARSGAAPSSCESAPAASSSSAAVSSSPSARQASRELDAHARGLVRRARAPASRPGPAQRGQRRVARRRPRARPRRARRRPTPRQHVALEPRASVASSSHALRASSSVARGEHDLDARPGAARARRSRSVVSPSTRRIAGGGGLEVALRQPQQRQARLRLEPAPARLAVAVLGRVELAPQAVELALPVRRAGRAARALPDAARRASPARASSSASGHAPCSCMISARWTRQRPVKATMSGWRSHQRARAAVHSCARRSS